MCSEKSDNVWKVRPIAEYTGELEKLLKESEIDSKSVVKRPRAEINGEHTKKTKASMED
jgi:hypothetical protein